MGIYHRIGVLIILALLLSTCGSPSSTTQDQPQPTGDQRMTVPTALATTMSTSSTLPSPIRPTTPLAYSPASTQPPAASAAPLTESSTPLPSRITPSTLTDLKLLREVVLPFAREAAIAPASDRLAVATPTSVVLFSLPSLQHLQNTQRSLPQRAEPMRLAFHPAGTAVMLRETAFGEGLEDRLTTWPLTATGATGEAREISLLVNEQFALAAFSSTGAVAWQDPETGHMILQQSAHLTRTLTTIADTPDLLQSTTEPDKGVSRITTNVTALEFSADGSLLGLGSRTGKVMLFQTAEGTRLEPLEVPNPVPEGVIEQLAFSPDTTLVGAQLTDRLIVWQIGAKIPMLELKMHPSHPDSIPSHDVLTVSPDNQLLITANADGVRFYEVKTGAELRTLPLVSQGLALSPDGRFAVIVHNGKVSVWGTESAAR